ncbi:hypothetical protein [Nitrobacter sp. JJSN]|uniref:hypothetical protein n=1 Tax=Nitrobacter sp. JJSN TaxID=3453033 RepID=UPI003F7617BB
MKSSRTAARNRQKTCAFDERPPVTPAALFALRLAGKERPMSLSSAKNYALRAARSQDQKEAAELLSKAILELAASIEATDAKIKKLNKSG